MKIWRVIYALPSDLKSLFKIEIIYCMQWIECNQSRRYNFIIGALILLLFTNNILLNKFKSDS